MLAVNSPLEFTAIFKWNGNYNAEVSKKYTLKIAQNLRYLGDDLYIIKIVTG